MKVKCPLCPQQYEVSTEYVGKIVACQTCGNNFVVSAPKADAQGASESEPAPTTAQASNLADSQKDKTLKRIFTNTKSFAETLSQIGASANSNSQQNPDSPIAPITSGDGCMALLDFKFCKFVAPSLMRILYAIWFWLSLLIAIVGGIMQVVGIFKFASLIGKNSLEMVVGGILVGGVILFVITPLLWMLNLVIVRMWFEFAMAIFNMERLARKIEENTRGTGAKN